VLYAELGMLEEAQREVSELVADGLAAIPRDSLWPAALSYLSDVCALSGDGTHAGALYAQLLPYRGLVIQVGHFLGAYGAADRHLGMLAALAGRAREAEQHFEAALRIDTRAQMPVWAARSHLAYGRFLATHCDRASIDRAQSLLGIAADAATRLGLPVVGAAAEKELGQLRQARTTRTASAAIGSTGLTDRELKILALLVQGQSNRQIGDQLHISHHTAANHVRAILLKTGCANRTEAAAWAVRNGLVSP
jgi:DNA-binding CsgD family transcriptional regulator